MISYIIGEFCGVLGTATFVTLISKFILLGIKLHKLVQLSGLTERCKENILSENKLLVQSRIFSLNLALTFTIRTCHLFVAQGMIIVEDC